MQTNPDLGKRGFIPALKYVASPQGRTGNCDQSNDANSRGG